MKTQYLSPAHFFKNWQGIPQIIFKAHSHGPNHCRLTPEL